MVTMSHIDEIMNHEISRMNSDDCFGVPLLYRFALIRPRIFNWEVTLVNVILQVYFIP